jgi:endonuclease/exonuclease/phosphatase family metal-dependent hydrolase
MVSRTPVKEWRRIDLGKSVVGMPLLIPTPRGVRPIYVRDEPRIAIAAITQSGWIIINTHLSFVPFVNKFQLAKLKRWAVALGREFGIAKERIIIGGDLNLPAKWLVQSKNWRSLVSAATYPSWQAKVQFDFFLGAPGIQVARSEVRAHAGVSDHLAITIELPE